MSYYKSAILRAPFDVAIERTEAALKEEGFGVISRIDIQEALKTKIGVDFRPYTILGACNPSIAYEALKIEDKIRTMLPCNVVVQEKSGEETEVAAIDPVASRNRSRGPESALQSDRSSSRGRRAHPLSAAALDRAVTLRSSCPLA